MAVVNCKKFHYDRATSTFSADASDLGQSPFLHPLIKGAVRRSEDVGIGILSPKTGRTAYYCLASRDLDACGEIVSWTLVPTWETLSNIPELTGTKVVIIND